MGGSLRMGDREGGGLAASCGSGSASSTRCRQILTCLRWLLPMLLLPAMPTAAFSPHLQKQSNLSPMPHPRHAVGHQSYPEVVRALCGRRASLLLQLSLVFRCAGLMIVYVSTFLCLPLPLPLPLLLLLSGALLVPRLLAVQGQPTAAATAPAAAPAPAAHLLLPSLPPRKQVIIAADVLAGHEGAPGLLCDLLHTGSGGWCGSRQLAAGVVALCFIAPLVTPKRLASTAITRWGARQYRASAWQYGSTALQSATLCCMPAMHVCPRSRPAGTSSHCRLRSAVRCPPLQLDRPGGCRRVGWGDAGPGGGGGGARQGTPPALAARFGCLQRRRCSSGHSDCGCHPHPGHSIHLPGLSSITGQGAAGGGRQEAAAGWGHC